MLKNNIRRIFIVAGIISLFVSYLGIWIRLINDPVERTGSDFIAFYTAGRIAQNNGASHVYDIALQRQVQEEQVGFPLAQGQVLQYNHLPFLIPVLQFIVTPNYVNSFSRWVLIMMTVYMISIGILGRTLKQSGADTETIRLTAIGGLLFLPVFFSLMNGQDTSLLLLGTAIWAYGLITGQDWTAGLGLSLTTVRPHFALILGIPMLFRHRKVFLAFFLGSSALALFSVLILGVEGTQEFINIILVSARGEWYGIKENVMFNLIGLLIRTLPIEKDVIRLIGWIVYGIAIVVLCVLWSRKKDSRSGQIGLTATVAVLAVPHLHFHDLSLLLIPIYELIRISIENRHPQKEIVILLPIVISLLLLASNATPVLQYTIPYLVMLGLAGYPYYLRDKSSLIAPHPP